MATKPQTVRTGRFYLDYQTRYLVGACASVLYELSAANFDAASHLGSTVVAATSGTLRTHQVMRRNIIFRRAKQNRTKIDLNDWPRRKLCVPTTTIGFS
jgi:hypothetical protein